MLKSVHRQAYILIEIPCKSFQESFFKFKLLNESPRSITTWERIWLAVVIKYD